MDGRSWRCSTPLGRGATSAIVVVTLILLGLFGHLPIQRQLRENHSLVRRRRVGRSAPARQLDRAARGERGYLHRLPGGARPDPRSVAQITPSTRQGTHRAVPAAARRASTAAGVRRFVATQFLFTLLRHYIARSLLESGGFSGYSSDGDERHNPWRSPSSEPLRRHCRLPTPGGLGLWGGVLANPALE